MGSPARKLTMFDATMLVMGGIIGVGIFFKPPQVAEWVPETWAYFTVWGLGALAALAGAMTFAELAGSFPRTGGWYVYLREGFGGLIAFLFAWIVLLVISTGACAGVADFFAGRLGLLLGLDVGDVNGPPPPLRRGLAAGAVLLVTLLAMTGVKSGAVFQNLCMLAKLLAIGVLVLTGLALFGEPALATEVPVEKIREGSLGVRMIGAALPVLFSYGGWQLLSYIGPHVEDPQRNLPRAIVLGVVGVALVYLLFNAAYVRVLGMGGILNGDAALDLAEATLGAVGGRFLTAAMAISALGFLVATLIATPGIYVAMAREGLFFEAVGREHPRSGAPVMALGIQATITLGYIAFHSDLVSGLADAVVFSEWIFHGLAALALLHMRRVRSGLERPFKSPLYPLFPVIYGVLAVAVVLGNLATNEWSVTAQGLVVLAVGAVVYLAWRRPGGGARWARSAGLLLGLLSLTMVLAHGRLIDLFGGHSQRRVLGGVVQLSPQAHALVDRCFEGLEEGDLVDYHAHLAGVGEASDCWVNPRLRSLWHARDYLRFRVYRSAADFSDGDLDSAFVDDLAALAQGLPRPPRPLLLAFDHRYDSSGNRDLERSEFFVPNDHALSARDDYPEAFHAAASIHPLRQDALSELERVHAAGVRLIKWLPAAQGIDPSSERCDAFYEACARLGVALLVHVGEEQAVHVAQDQDLGNPLHLRRPLEAGVRVIAAHCASLGTDVDLDDPARGRVPSFELFLRLMGEPEWEGLFFGGISAVTQVNRYGEVLETLLERADLHPRLVNGSDWPLPAVNVLFSTIALCRDGFLEESEREALNEIYHHNPLLFDFCLKRVVRAPGSGARFGDEVFDGVGIPLGF